MNQLVFNNFRNSSADWYRDISLAAFIVLLNVHILYWSLSLPNLDICIKKACGYFTYAATIVAYWDIYMRPISWTVFQP